MPRLDFTANEGGAWKPLPTATYDIQIDACDTGVSSKGNPQIKLAGHIVGGNSDGKKVTIWYVLKGGGWRVKEILDAAGIEYDEEDTGVIDDEGRPEKMYGFDTDDLPGCIIRFDVSEGEYEGKPKNNFNKPRAPEGPIAGAKPRVAPAAATAQQPKAAAAAPAAAPAAAAPADAGRRRVVRTGAGSAGTPAAS